MAYYYNAFKCAYTNFLLANLRCSILSTQAVQSVT